MIQKRRDGSPRSQAKADIWREAVATTSRVLQCVVVVTMNAMTVASAPESVALEKSWMYGYPVGPLTTSLILPKP